MKFTAVGDPLIVPTVEISCDVEMFFNECREVGGSDNIPSVFISCEDKLSFSECRDVISSENLPPVTMFTFNEEDN